MVSCKEVIHPAQGCLSLHAGKCNLWLPNSPVMLASSRGTLAEAWTNISQNKVALGPYKLMLYFLVPPWTSTGLHFPLSTISHA